MPLARRGRKLSDGTVVVQGTTSASVDQMRCPYCQNLAVAVVGQQGMGRASAKIYRCQTCQRTFKSTRL